MEVGLAAVLLATTIGIVLGAISGYLGGAWDEVIMRMARTRCQKFAGELSEAERQRCIDEPPELVDRGQGHPSACHYAEVVSVV